MFCGMRTQARFRIRLAADVLAGHVDPLEVVLVRRLCRCRPWRSCRPASSRRRRRCPRSPPGRPRGRGTASRLAVLVDCRLGAVPVQVVGSKPFQSNVLLTMRLPSSSSKPLALPTGPASAMAAGRSPIQSPTMATRMSQRGLPRRGAIPSVKALSLHVPRACGLSGCSLTVCPADPSASAVDDHRTCFPCPPLCRPRCSSGARRAVDAPAFRARGHTAGHEDRESETPVPAVWSRPRQKHDPPVGGVPKVRPVRLRLGALADDLSPPQPPRRIRA